MPLDLEKEDRIITQFLESLGPWCKHIIIGGGYAPIIYKLYFCNHTSNHTPVGTRDIDSLISRKLPDASEKNIGKHLLQAGFLQTFRDRSNPATESYRKHVEDTEIEIEFLTDSLARNHRNKNVSISGVVAQPLSYLQLSLQKTLPFQTFSNIEGKVVSPGAQNLIRNGSKPFLVT